ncbi:MULTISPECIES: hypothetical protein [unclassified Rhodococcus (in: high G+C Gram-positive bacteria)]|uniref:hypothetical protein n=1 Tax=unclassified Rhodococcus (in: high G+C Gram-positive bacteria) TaxID=192944 RepID=UPI0007BC41C9|nr:MULTISPECIES: hypothetical protein [unclassified Rhodococcus (in: high G+C Gram-positive bacteria)]KZF06324.1 hypothetical protein A2J02_22035 [Rhodococcus sp. EPR-147]KZF09032.1 hypothetical protein A2J04_22565 [Rhodococcus sp. EPR-279]
MATVLDSAGLDRLTAAVLALNPRPRERRWVSLSFAIVDAVWSIGATYATTVVPLVSRVAADFGVSQPSVPNSEPPIPDPVSLGAFHARFDVDSLTARTNRQRTSARGGTSKAHAVLDHVEIFRAAGIDTLDQARAIMSDGPAFDRLDTALQAVPGEGGHGVRRGYLWMLIGDDDRIKPDRMVLRWLRSQGVAASPVTATAIVREIVARINDIPGERRTTAWEVDHVLWQAGRALPA